MPVLKRYVARLNFSPAASLRLRPRRRLTCDTLLPRPLRAEAIAGMA
jgi:hypothetical protein